MGKAWALGAGVAFFLLTGALVGQEGEKSAKKTDDPWVQTKPEGGVLLSASVAPQTKAGDPVPVKIRLTNKGKELVNVAIDRWGALDVDVRVLDSDGKKVPLTRYGVKRLDPVELEDVIANGRASWRLDRIMPSKSIGLSINNLGLFYDLTVPGDYSLTLTRAFCFGAYWGKEPIELTTPPLRFTIERR